MRLRLRLPLLLACAATARSSSPLSSSPLATTNDPPAPPSNNTYCEACEFVAQGVIAYGCGWAKESCKSLPVPADAFCAWVVAAGVRLPGVPTRPYLRAILPHRLSPSPLMLAVTLASPVAQACARICRTRRALSPRAPSSACAAPSVSAACVLRRLPAQMAGALARPTRVAIHHHTKASSPQRNLRRRSRRSPGSARECA